MSDAVISTQLNSINSLGDKRKRSLGCVRTAKAQTSLCIRAVSSENVGQEEDLAKELKIWHWRGFAQDHFCDYFTQTRSDLFMHNKANHNLERPIKSTQTHSLARIVMFS